MIRRKKKKRRVAFSLVHSLAAVLSKHLRLVLLLMALVISLSLCYFVYARTVYHTRFLLQVEEFELDDADSPKRPRNIPAYLQKQLQSADMLLRTGRQLGLSGSIRDLRQRDLQDLRIQIAENDVLDVDVYVYRRSVAQGWAGAMYNAFAQEQQEELDGIRQRRVKLLQQDLKNLKAHQDAAADKLDILAEERNRWEKANQFSRVADVTAKLKAKGESLELARNVADQLKNPGLDQETKEEILEEAEKRLEIPATAADAGTDGKHQGNNNRRNGGESPARSVLEEKLEDLNTLLNMRLKIYHKDHPDVVTLQEQIAALEKQISGQLGGRRERFEAFVKTLDAEHRKLTEQSRQFAKLKRQATDYDARRAKLEAEQETAEESVAALQARIDKVMLEKIHPAYTLKPPEVLQSPERPVSPNVPALVLVTVAAMLILSLGAPLLIERLDNTFSVIEDAEEVLEIPSLGVIPRDLDADDEDAMEESQQLMETFRMLRTNIITGADEAHPRQVIMVTSSVPQEGKSTVAVNLARSFAKLGEQTLLADLDLRRGHLHDHFEQEHQPGVTEMITTTEYRPKEFIRSTNLTGLSFLPGGQRIENVSEMLATDAFAELISKFRQNFTRIILDTPPALGLAETSGLLPLVDGVVLVIWSGYTPAPHVQAAVNQLRQNDANFLGFVLNKVDMRCAKNKLHYYYYSDYYYSSYQD